VACHSSDARGDAAPITDRDAPADTPEGRRDQLDRELSERATALARRRPRLPYTGSLGLNRTETRIAKQLALTLLARAHRDEYLKLLAETSARVAGGR
jgi:hypothetical protein